MPHCAPRRCRRPTRQQAGAPGRAATAEPSARAAQAVQQPQRGNRAGRHRQGEESLKPRHPPPGLGSLLRNAGTKAMATNGRASPRPSAAKTSDRPGSGSSKAVPSAAPRNGPAHGVATNAASTPVPKLPAGCARPPSTGSSNTPSRLAVIATASRSRSMIVRGSCSWNAQPASRPRRGSASRPRRARRCRRPRPRCSRARPPCLPRVARRPATDASPSARGSGTRRASDSAGSRRQARRGPPHRMRFGAEPADRRAARGHGPGTARNSSPRPSPSASTPSNCGAAAPLRASSATSVSPVAAERLRRRVIDGVVGDGKDVWLADRDAGRQRDGDAQRSPARRNAPTVRAAAASARRHASNCARFGVPPPTGTSSDKSPCSGTQILSVQASQCASARIGIVPRASAGTFSRTSTA